MSQEELARIRTDTLFSILLLKDVDVPSYQQAMMNADMLANNDMAISSAVDAANNKPPYSMLDLSSPLSAARMVIPNQLTSYLAGHAKIMNDPVSDWPQASPENSFGDHHPFGFQSNCCPLLHGAAHGEPEYVPHVLSLIDNEQMGLKHMDSLEKDAEVIPKGHQGYFGSPIENMHDLYVRDRNKHAFKTDDEYMEFKKSDLQKGYGMLPYLFGLEYNTDDQRRSFFELLSQLSQTSNRDVADSKRIKNKFQEQSGISWGRALRNWRARFKPLASWWERAPDRHGPTEPHQGGPLQHYHSPYVKSQQGEINESATYHWWDLFQPWGGVGRSIDSLESILGQSYPQVFDGPEGWLNDVLITNTAFHEASPNGPHSHGGSHFPNAANNMEMDSPMRPAVSSGFAPDDDYESRRAMYSHAANRQYLHPSEVQGAGGRIDIPDDALLFSGLGRAIASQADMGSPRVGMKREEHPSSNELYWAMHNQHFRESDRHIGRVMQQMSQKVLNQFGPEILNPAGSSDEMAHTIARGNLQQIAAAANHALMRTPIDDSYRSVGIDPEFKKVMGPIGPVSPNSHTVVPPVYLSGDTDAWGHEMPATLTWRFDPNQGGYVFSQADEPFTIMQRTVHENHVNMVSPSLVESSSKILGKQKDINALSAVDEFGYSPIQNNMLRKADDYEPTGVYENLIEPAHTLYDLSDVNTIKGFSGDWVVQKMPKGKRVMVKKSGKKIEPASLPDEIKKALKKRDGDFTLDAYIDKGMLNVVDLLVHKGTDLSYEPLEDRMNVLRTLYHSDSNIHFPMPTNCSTTDIDGLSKTVEAMEGSNYLIRDATSTFIKGKEAHPKWIKLVDESISKEFVHGLLPEISVKHNTVLLSYPSILMPIIVKGSFDGRYRMDIDDYEGPDYLVKHAKKQSKMWGPVAISLLKEAFASTDAGSHNPVHSIPVKRKKPRKRVKNNEIVVKASALLDNSGDVSKVQAMMKQALHLLRDKEKPMSTSDMCSKVKGLTPKLLDTHAGEYGLDKVEGSDNMWTVNEAIDDDVAQKSLPRMNRASPDGGAWSGMQADLTSPTGPTEVTEESGTTIGADPNIVDEEEQMPKEKPYHLEIRADPEKDGPATIDIENGKAKLRYPKRSPQEQKEEDEIPADVKPAVDEEAVDIPLS